jgi:hypothetical protein
VGDMEIEKNILKSITYISFNEMKEVLKRTGEDVNQHEDFVFSN